MSNTVRDRFRGMMLGMACGDALGAQVEFKPRGSFPEQRDMTGGGPHNLSPGQWTDDTAMALHLAEHLLVDRYVCNPRLLAKRWNNWRLHGVGSCTGTCFDVGAQTCDALSFWHRHGRAPIMRPDMRGNGAIMRVVPVVLAHPEGGWDMRAAAKDQAAITHPVTCGELCADFATLLAKCAARSPEGAKDLLSRENPHFLGRLRDDVQSTGYDVHTYEAAVWAVLHASSLEEAVVLAVNLGDDADTVGAVTGALAGAVWGAEGPGGVPSRWLRALAWGPLIMGHADAFYALLEGAQA